ncbi:MAG TPA: HlyD family efflux transporter periplasmic adaptor subunit [bacterium]|nr:HlyD family efflux transporter periplasmic adaptor subunit [bacterium]
MNIKKTWNWLIENSPVTRKWGAVWGIRTYAAIGVVILLLLILVAFNRSSAVSSSVKWARVQEGPFEVTLVESGEIRAVNQQMVTAPMTWSTTLQIVELIPEGTRVKKGDPLIHFDVADIETQLDLARDRLTTLHADLQKLEAEQSRVMMNLENQLKLAEYSYEQAVLRLEMRQFESEARKEEARLSLKQAEIDLARINKQLESQVIINNSQRMKLEMSIRQAENRVRDFKERLEEFTLRAPNDGMVVYQEVGSFNSRERLKMGYTANPREDLIAIPDLSKMQIKLHINEVDRPRVVPGQRVRFAMEAYPDAQFTGTVREVSRLAELIDFEARLKGFSVYIDVDQSDPRLKPGMTAQACIILESFENVLTIPVGTLFELDGRPVVFPWNSNRPVLIETGLRNDGYVVVQGGLKKDMRISYKRPDEGIAVTVYGRAEEERRIDALAVNLQESFDIFRQRGILYNYFKDEITESEKPAVDLDRLPPSIRERLMQSRPKGAEPEDKVGESGEGRGGGSGRENPGKR